MRQSKNIKSEISNIKFVHFANLLFLIFMTLLLNSCNLNKPIARNDLASQKSDKLKIEYIAHASFILTYEDLSLLLDPFADTTWISYFFPRDINADAIFSTHPHYDHDGGIFRDLKPYWQGQIPFYDDPGTYNLGAFKIEGIKGKHCDPYGKEFGQKNTIFIFEVAGLRIAHWGDNGPINDSLSGALTDIDILMLPIDDTYHILKADETQEAIKAINPKIVIPMHYKIADLESTPGRPKNLGTIDEYLRVRSNKEILDTNIIEISSPEIPGELQYLVFRHSPAVKQFLP